MIRPAPRSTPPRPGHILAFILGGMALYTLWGLYALTSTATGAPSAAHDHDSAQEQAQAQALHAQALYSAEAGIDEARARLRLSASPHRLVDTAPDDPSWSATLSPQDTPLPAADDIHHVVRLASMQNALPYLVTLRHATRTVDGAVLRWGDAQGTGVPSRNTTHGEPVYVLTARGMAGDTNATVEVEAAYEPPPTVPAALSAGGPVRLGSVHTHFNDTDSCDASSQPGGQLSMAAASGVSHSTPLQVHKMVAALKARATHAHTAGGSWGTPMLGATRNAPSLCHEYHIVYYDTQGTQGRLASGTTGCGLLLVEGDVDIAGELTWYGPMLITGSLHGTAQSRLHVTGGLVVGGAVTFEAEAEAQVLYCRAAIAQPTQTLPLRILSWRTVLPAT